MPGDARKVTKRPLREALADGWLACAPPDLAAAYIPRRRGSRGPTAQGQPSDPSRRSS